LFAIAYLTAPPAEVVVAPKLVDVDAITPDAESDVPQPRTQVGAERVTEPAAVRDYQSGDPRRLVHWKATARRDRLMVREVVLRGLPQTWVLVDNAANPADAAEAALSVSASVALRLLRAGHTVHLAYLDAARARDARFEPAAGQAPLMAAFARVELAPAERESARKPGRWRLGPRAGGRMPGDAPSNRPDGVATSREAAPLSRRVFADLGARGAVAPVYGAFAQADGHTRAELGRLASVARPGQLWLTGRALADSADQLRAQGWTVAVAE
jgi:uncharacterized protein (DUF58 family)